MNIGIIGCGNISGAYLKATQLFKVLNVTCVADIDVARAQAKAQEFSIAKGCSPSELLADDSIDMVINLTIPSVHAQISKEILAAGKHVYSEKPLGIRYSEGKELLDIANAKGLRVGCAPDTFLGAGLQTARKVLDEGWIGTPTAATAFFVGHGPEAWHPNPDFFYEEGAGPLFDIGPYSLTAFIHFFGAIKRLSASANKSMNERTLTKPDAERYGEKIPVHVPTHVSSLLEFDSGVNATLITSFDVHAHNLPFMEIYGTQGVLSVPDPNTFAGPVRVRRYDAKEWLSIPLAFDYSENSRGLGAADMATAIASGRKHRASGALALHVLEAMENILTAAKDHSWLDMQSTLERPQALPMGLLKGVLDD